MAFRTIFLLQVPNYPPGAIYFPSPRSRPFASYARVRRVKDRPSSRLSSLSSNALKVGHPTPTFVPSLSEINPADISTMMLACFRHRDKKVRALCNYIFETVAPNCRPISRGDLILWNTFHRSTSDRGNIHTLLRGLENGSSSSSSSNRILKPSFLIPPCANVYANLRSWVINHHGGKCD